MKCYECSSMMKKATKPYHYVESGLNNVYLKNIDYFVCGKCGDEIVEIPDIAVLHLVLELATMNRRRPLNRSEVVFLRKAMDLNAKEFADALGVTNVTVSRWETGKSPINDISDTAIRLLYWKYIQQKLADRVDTLEATIEAQNIVEQQKQRTSIDISKLQYMPRPSIIENAHTNAA